jgi:hypothetical protein
MASSHITAKVNYDAEASLKSLFLPVNEISFILIETGCILFSCRKAALPPYIYIIFHYACSSVHHKLLAYISFIDGRFKPF